MFDSLLTYLSCLFIVCSDPVVVTPSEPSQPVVVNPIVIPDEKPIVYNIPGRCNRLTNYFIDAENPSLWAGQIYQESTCNSHAKSPYANGVAQITPRTGEGLARGICKDMGPYRPFDDMWQMICGLRLQEENERYAARKFPELDYCDMKAMGQKIYNGGYWAVWEYQYAGDLVKARQICGKVKLHNGRKRANWACEENYKYPDYVRKHQPIFTDLGGRKCEN